jgi:TonB family protein
VINIMGPGFMGVSDLRGGMGGSGLDRGPSGANNPSPQVLEQTPVQVPPMVALHPPTKLAVFRVEVLANGQVGRVTLEQPSGSADFDEAARASIVTSKFRPAYEAGKAVRAEMTISFNPGLDSE